MLKKVSEIRPAGCGEQSYLNYVHRRRLLTWSGSDQLILLASVIPFILENAGVY